ncbi:xanthine dehydrogenase family protein subunit M [SAR202 cluster bacterium AD-802-E10_MRT_200m]|nr:xanthine dehydrogenase family protein subunit M [SAR202 cluster bacterium AD-802-E10_MRT_200m]
MRDFIYHSPETLEESLHLLEAYGENARPIAGGTAVVTLMKQNLILADHLVSLDNLSELRAITEHNEHVTIGALTTHRQLETNLSVQRNIPLIAEAFNRVATIRIRNIATVGGSLAHADPAQDPPPALIVSDAHVTLTSPTGTRQLPVEKLFLDYYQPNIEPNELLTSLTVPKQPEDTRTVYLKFLPRSQDDYATVSVAALGKMKDGQCQDIKLALGCAGPTPIRASKLENELKGKSISPKLLELAAESVAEEIDPIDDSRGSSLYKRDMAIIFTRRALAKVLEIS